MIRRYLPKSTEELIHWYERYMSPLALITGFLVDNFFLLDRVDVVLGNVLLVSYLGVAALAIATLHYIESGRVQNAAVLSLAPFIPVTMQFAFGALFSGYLALYSRSASIAISWIFVIAIASLLIGNERFRRLYTKAVFQIGIWFTALFSFLIFFLPVVLRTIGPWVFLLAGAVSIALVAAFLGGLYRLVPERVTAMRTTALRAIALIFITFNVLYFTNLIPPLPLSLKDAGVYHSVSRTGWEYHLLAEPLPWYRSFLNYNTTYHRYRGEGAYVFTSVFAPSGLSTIILHEWQYYDPAMRDWVTKSTLQFSIYGGQDKGFRGYTKKSSLQEGSWRVNVLTQYGQLIGRVKFTVINSPEKPELIEEVH